MHLNAHCYQEGQEKKGGDNVASMVIQCLCDQVFIKHDGDGSPICVKKLVGADDNCSGKNKNDMDLWLLPWLVEEGCYAEAKLLFYVRGPMKNVCDRLFCLIS